MNDHRNHTESTTLPSSSSIDESSFPNLLGQLGQSDIVGVELVDSDEDTSRGDSNEPLGNESDDGELSFVEVCSQNHVS